MYIAKIYVLSKTKKTHQSFIRKLSLYGCKNGGMFHRCVNVMAAIQIYDPSLSSQV